MLKKVKKLDAIQVRIDDNVRMMAELRARWEREDELAKTNNVTKVCTITTTSNNVTSKPPTTIGKVVGVNKVSSPSMKRVKLLEITETVPDKSAEIFRDNGDNGSIAFDNNDIDFDDCNISEVIMFLQKLDRKSVV